MIPQTNEENSYPCDAEMIRKISEMYRQRSHEIPATAFDLLGNGTKENKMDEEAIANIVRQVFAEQPKQVTEHKPNWIEIATGIGAIAGAIASIIAVCVSLYTMSVKSDVKDVDKKVDAMAIKLDSISNGQARIEGYLMGKAENKITEQQKK